MKKKKKKNFKISYFEISSFEEKLKQIILEEGELELLGTYEENADFLAKHFTNNMNFEVLADSLYLSDVIQSWIDLYTLILQDPGRFGKDLEKMRERFTDKIKYVQFRKQVEIILSRQGEHEYVSAITQIL